MVKTSQNLSNFLDFVRHVQQEYDSNYKEVNTCDKETDDILHQLEFGLYKERSKFATKLSTVRKRRRAAKDYVDVNSERVTYLKTPEFRIVYNRLTNILGVCRKQEEYVNNQRRYKSKIRNDLTIN